MDNEITGTVTHNKLYIKISSLVSCKLRSLLKDLRNFYEEHSMVIYGWKEFRSYPKLLNNKLY